MRLSGILAVGALFLVFLAGCPFETRVPLAEPAPGSIDSRLVGFWSGINTKDGDSLEVVIMPFNDAEYYIEVRDGDGPPERYRAYAIAVAGEYVLQINEIGPGEASDGYVFARYAFTDERDLMVQFVGEKIVPKELETDPAGLFEFLSGHMGDAELDDEDLRLALRPDVGEE
jgi:hypothetical protein